MPDFRGFTFYVVVGRFGGFGIKRDGDSIRLCLGWIGLAVCLFDMEQLLGAVVSEIDKQKKECCCGNHD